MTRMKTTGISLKVLSAKLQKLPFSYRIAGSGFLLAVLSLNSLLIAGCAPSRSGGAGTVEIDGFVLKEIEMENVRFEPQGLDLIVTDSQGMAVSIPPAPAFTYWLRRGDAIAPRWDTHEWHWEEKGAMCGFIDNTSDGGCQVCDYCNPPSSDTGTPCMGAHPIYFPGALEVVADSGFIQTDNPQVVLSYIFRGTGDVLGACANNTDTSNQLIFLEPATSGLYRLRSNQVTRFRGATNGEIKIHVVEKGAGLAQRAAYQLTRQTVDGANYWTWTIEGDPLWLENFSPNLRVTDVRIFRGECADGSAQGKQCAIYGAGFIELAARGGDYRIYHWRYRNGVWSQPAAIANQIISAPILMSTGAGQLELLAVDVDYHLFRWRFVGNAWQPRLSIAHDFRIDNALFSSLSASSWGDGTVDLVVVGLETRNLYHRRIGPGNEICTQPLPSLCPAPRVFSNLGGRIMEDPVLTAFSPTRLNALTMQGLKWHSIWASKHPNQWFVAPAPPDPRLLWSAVEYIGGDEMVIGGAAHAGRNNFVAVAIRDGQFYINRNEGGLWTGFQPIIGQNPDQILRSPIFLPAIAAHGAGG